MSDQERDLLRIHAWDRYQKATESYRTHKQKLMRMGTTLMQVGNSLARMTNTVTEYTVGQLPSREELIEAVQEHQGAVAELKHASTAASELRWPVDQELIKEIGTAGPVTPRQ